MSISGLDRGLACHVRISSELGCVADIAEDQPPRVPGDWAALLYAGGWLVDGGRGGVVWPAALVSSLVQVDRLNTGAAGSGAADIGEGTKEALSVDMCRSVGSAATTFDQPGRSDAGGVP